MVQRPDPERWILHADMDAFYASIEQRDHPELRGLPVVVGATTPRGVVAAASYEARQFGVHSAMPGFKARKLCPHAVFLRADMPHYVAVSARVRSVFEEFTPSIEPLALDEAFLDITGSLCLYKSPLELARQLKQRVLEALSLNVSVGLANTKLVAKIACTLGKPNGLKLVSAHEVRKMLDPLPIRRLWGVGPVMADRLGQLDIRSIRDLRLYDVERLTRELGERALELQSRARGEDPRPVEPERAPKSYGEENTFESDVSDRQTVVDALTAHSEAVARRLRHDHWLGRTVALKIKFAMRQPKGERSATLYPVITRQKTLPEPTNDGAMIRRVVVRLWDDENITQPVRLVGVTLSGLLEARPTQLELFDSGKPATELERTLDAIQSKFGAGAIRRGAQNPTKLTPSAQVKRGE